MSRFQIVIRRIDDEDGTEHVTDLDHIDLPAPDARFLQKETALDHLEAQTLASGHAVMRQLLLRQWERVDAQLVANYQELFSPASGDFGRPRAAQGGEPAGPPAAPPPGARSARRRRARDAGE